MVANAGASRTEVVLDQFVQHDPRRWNEVGFVTGHPPREVRELYSHVAGAMWSLRKLPMLGRENSAPDRPRRATVSADLVRRIEEMTAVDHAIYEAALRRSPEVSAPD